MERLKPVGLHLNIYPWIFFFFFSNLIHAAQGDKSYTPVPMNIVLSLETLDKPYTALDISVDRYTYY